MRLKRVRNFGIYDILLRVPLTVKGEKRAYVSHPLVCHFRREFFVLKIDSPWV